MVPPFANTAMDGYAVRASDTAGASDARAGRRCAWSASSRRVSRRRLPVGPGEAIRIMTGAPMPAGADAVVMVERTRADGRDASTSSKRRRPATTCAPRAAISRVGQRVFEAGTLLTPAHLGVLASLDVAEVLCHPRPRVGVCSTGDELVASGPLAPGTDPRLEPADAARGARRSRAASRSTSASRATTSRCSPTTIARALDECDALVTSGAVSMGDYDFVKVVLERLAAERPATAGTRTPTRGCRSRSSPRSRSRSRRSAACRCSGCPAIRCRRV